MTSDGASFKSDPALDRVDAITPVLLWEVRHLVETRAVMEAGNQTVIEHGMVFGGHAMPFNIIQSRLAMALASDLARVFDFSQGRAPESQKKASIPILVHYLRQADVRAALERRAADGVAWLVSENCEACREAITQAIAAYEALNADVVTAASVDRIRQLRTQRLAHYLYDQEPSRPLYSDLFSLTDFAATFIEKVTLAVMAGQRDMQAREDDVGRVAKAFWRDALAHNQMSNVNAAIG